MLFFKHLNKKSGGWWGREACFREKKDLSKYHGLLHTGEKVLLHIKHRHVAS